MSARLLTLAALAACASAPPRVAPPGLAAPAPMGRMLHADPPLPGEDLSGWPGLEARPPAGVSVEEAVRRALGRSGDRHAALREVEAERARVRSAGALPDPSVELEGTSRRDGAPGRFEVGVGFDLTAAVLAPARAGAEEEGVRAAEARAAAVERELELGVRAAYRAVQAGRERLHASTRTLDALAASAEMASALAAAGNVPALVEESHRAALEEARVELARAEAALSAARAELASLLGEDVEVEAGIAPPARDEVPADAVDRAVRASLELAELERQEARARRRGAVLAVAGSIPDVSVRAFGEREDGRWGAGAGVEIGLPIFGRDRRSAAAEVSSAAAIAARRQALAMRVAAQARGLVERARAAREIAANQASKVVPARERVLAQTLLQYDAMQVDAFELLRAHRELLRARLRAIDAERERADALDALQALLAGASARASRLSPGLDDVIEAGPAGGGH